MEMSFLHVWCDFGLQLQLIAQWSVVASHCDQQSNSSFLASIRSAIAHDPIHLPVHKAHLHRL